MRVLKFAPLEFYRIKLQQSSTKNLKIIQKQYHLLEVQILYDHCNNLESVFLSRPTIHTTSAITPMCKCMYLYNTLYTLVLSFQVYGPV